MTLAAHKTDDSAIVLSADDLPCAFLEKSNRSARYVDINSSRTIEIAQNNDWVLFNAGQQRKNSRSLNKNPNAAMFAPHFLAFRPSDNWMESRGLMDKLRFDGGIGKVSKVFPRVIFYNGHDGKTAIEARMGIFEFICSNSAIMCSDEWGSWKFRHTGIDADKVFNQFFRSVLEAAPYLVDIRDEMQAMDVTKAQALEYAETVIDLRYDGEKFSVNPHDLIKPMYKEQSDLTAYNVFNNVQRSLIQGGFNATNKQYKGKRNPTRKQTAIRGILEDKKINLGLWEKTQDWLSNMGRQLPAPPTIDADVRKIKEA